MSTSTLIPVPMDPASASPIIRRLQYQQEILRTRNGQPYVRTGRLNKFLPTGKSLTERLWERIDVRLPYQCWPWIGAESRGGRSPDGRYGLDRQRITYGALCEGTLDGGSAKRTWRAHLLVCLLKTETLIDVPPDADEDFIPWIRRARRYYVEIQGLQASHQCDNSLCCNPQHLEWEAPEEHLVNARWRAGKRAEDPNWLPVCCLPPEQGGYGWSREQYGEPQPRDPQTRTTGGGDHGATTQEARREHVESASGPAGGSGSGGVRGTAD